MKSGTQSYGLLLSLVVAAACGTSPPVSVDAAVDGARDAPRDNLVEARVYAEASFIDGTQVCTDTYEEGVTAGTPPSNLGCNPCRPTGPGASAGGVCTIDSNCSAGINGRCFEHFRAREAYCSYDGCFQHSDCQSDQVCACGGNNSAAANYCMAAACRSNADCGGRLCAPTFGTCGHYEAFVAYQCHTTRDECNVDSDCQASNSNGYCAFDGTRNIWACSTEECAG